LLTLRDRLVRDRGGFEATWKEQNKALDENEYKGIFQIYKSLIENLTLQIKKLESQIKAVIDSDEKIKVNYQLLTSIKCVGPVLAANMIACTHNFTRFANWRKFACYVGTVPFEHQSGTSIKGKTRVSSLSNRQIKKLIHLVAICACAYNPELKGYYKRRVSEGKNKMSTLNVIRNKLIARMFAVVNRGDRLRGSDEICSLVLFILTRKHLFLFWAGSVKGSEAQACGRSCLYTLYGFRPK
jgi:transposase